MPHLPTPRLTGITGRFEFDDGSSHEFSIGPDLGWQQFGATHDQLVARGTSELLEALTSAAAEWQPDEPDEDEDVEPYTPTAEDVDWARKATNYGRDLGL